jgi:hypothetical protein
MSEYHVGPKDDKKKQCWAFCNAATPRLAMDSYIAMYGKKYNVARVTDLACTLNGKLCVSQPASTEMSTYDDSQFIRTAIVMRSYGKGGSLDVVDEAGERLCQINISFRKADGTEGNTDWLNVDIIDVDKTWPQRQAITFYPGKPDRRITGAGRVVATEFKRPPKAKKR